ncbi:SRPBCC domain-containing protein [Arthrobacter sp. H5]|uniref:SRPBCC family protein n=1 Tax=Arthrobacter sp. H5 TaxID=1267973 RepID=UPI00048584BF|nr:SRPBCC domain-containing protein [Arthrobacter sp. H5]
MPDYTTSIEVNALPETVFDYLVTEDGMTAWMGQRAALDPRPDGQFAVDIAGHAIRGHFVEIDRPRRVVLTWGMVGSDVLPPGASTVEFTLTPVAEGTRVDLVHSGLPQTEQIGHADGWSHFILRLGTAVVAGHAGPDDWRPLPDRRGDMTG